MIGLDTNVLVRYLTRDDPDQFRKADAALTAVVARGERCRVDDVVLCELVWVLETAYDLDRATIADVLERLLRTAQFTFDDKDHLRLALDAYRNGGADFADHVIGHSNARAGCTTTLTFDRKLRRTPTFSLL